MYRMMYEEWWGQRIQQRVDHSYSGSTLFGSITSSTSLIFYPSVIKILVDDR